MGDRANVVVIQPDNTYLYMYTHWGGSEIHKTLQRGMQFASKEGRLDDIQYLNRILFDSVTGLADALTGAGLSTELQDNEYPLLYVDPSKQTVAVEGITTLYIDQFIAQTLPKSYSDWIDQLQEVDVREDKDSLSFTTTEIVDFLDSLPMNATANDLLPLVDLCRRILNVTNPAQVDLDIMDEVLGKVTSDMSPNGLVSLLRTVNAFQDVFKNWNYALFTTYRSVGKNGDVDPEEALAGLL